MKAVQLGKKHFLNVAEYGKFLAVENNGVDKNKVAGMQATFSSNIKPFVRVEVVPEKVLTGGLVQCRFRSHDWKGVEMLVPQDCLTEQTQVTSVHLERRPAGRFEGSILSA